MNTSSKTNQPFLSLSSLKRKVGKSKQQYILSVWSAASSNNQKFVQRWVRKLRQRKIGGARCRARTGKATTQLSVCPSPAQRRLNAGPKFVVEGRPGDGGGCGDTPHDVDAPDVWSGWTPLMCASACGHAGIVEMLLGAGASPSCVARDATRMTAAHFAAQQGRLDILQRLVEVAPAVVYCRSSSSTDRKTPFHMACETDRFALVQWLLETDTTEEHRLVGVVAEDDESGYPDRIVDVLAEHRKIHTDRKFVIKAQRMRSAMGF